MDFFDPEKQKRHAIRLYIGYAFIAVALILATTILLYQAYGYGVDRKGRVIQNGLVFVSSHPEGGKIYVNNKLYKSATNTRMGLPAGQYKVRIDRDGYRSWQRAITVEGGSVERFDYSFLFPTKLVTSITKQYTEAPSMVSQSPDRRWLVIGLPTSNTLELFDLKAAKPQAQTLVLPEDILGGGTTTGWQQVAWSADNHHVVLRRNYQKDNNPGSEYILVERSDVTQTRNLTQLLGFTPSVLELRKGAYDQYYAFDQANGTVFTASLKKPTPQLFLENVLNFTSDKDTVLYATAKDAPQGKMQFRLRQGAGPTYVMRTATVGTQYLLDLSVYDGVPYVAAGVQNEDKVYVYQDPLSVLKREDGTVPAPVQILKVPGPAYVAFSGNARFVVAENNDRFSVYDAETDRGYAYQVKTPLDVPADHALWIDSYHMEVVSGGKLRVFDFDGANAQTLMTANPAYPQVFSPNLKTMYGMSPQHALAVTAMLTPKDQ
jgi:hypothetical protein